MDRDKTIQVGILTTGFANWLINRRRNNGPLHAQAVNGPQPATLYPKGDQYLAANMWLSDTLSRPSCGIATGELVFRDAESTQGKAEGAVLDEIRTLEQFLASVEKRAFQVAKIAVRDADDALDIVQDAMLQLARRYSDRPTEQWKPLFYRILQNRIQDCRRRRMVRAKFFGWLPTQVSSHAKDEEVGDPYEATRDETRGPQDKTMLDESMRLLEKALHDLPARQLQAFMLRNMEGMDVAETADAMGCSEGSVKTHYSRAVHSLRAQLADSWDASAEDFR